MKTELVYDKTTDVAYVDVCAMPAQSVRIDVIDVTEGLGYKTQVLARVDENGVVLGVIIEDFSAFKKEMRRKHLVGAIEGLLELLICKVRELISPRAEDCSQLHMASHA